MIPALLTAYLLLGVVSVFVMRAVGGYRFEYTTGKVLFAAVLTILLWPIGAAYLAIGAVADWLRGQTVDA